MRPKERLTAEERAKWLDFRTSKITQEEKARVDDMAERLYMMEVKIRQAAKDEALPFGLGMWAHKCAMSFVLASRAFWMDDTEWCHVELQVTPVERPLGGEGEVESPESSS